MPKRCAYVHRNGKACRRWPSEGSPFCYHHTQRVDVVEPSEGDDLHPLFRLTKPEDVFDVIRETLNAARLGRIRPGQVYAVGYMIQLWIRMYYMLDVYARNIGLYHQRIPDLADMEEVADEALTPIAEVAAVTPVEPDGKEAEVQLKDAAEKLKKLQTLVG